MIKRVLDSALLFGLLVAANLAASAWAWTTSHDRSTLLETALLA